MATTNNPENQNSKPHGLGDQVQISKEHASPTAGKTNNYSGPMKDYIEPRNPLTWVIVENAGRDEERIYGDHATYRAAIQCAIRELGPEFIEDGYDIMRRQDDGTLTTEF